MKGSKRKNIKKFNEGEEKNKLYVEKSDFEGDEYIDYESERRN